MSRRDQLAFVERLLSRRPESAQIYAAMLSEPDTGAGARREAATLESTLSELRFASDAALETIVRRERPVFFVASEPDTGTMRIDDRNVSLLGPDAEELKLSLNVARPRIEPLLPRIGRIDLEGIAGMPFVGTGWMIDDGIVVTNRHVADVFAMRAGARFEFRMGAYGRPLSASFDVGHLRDEEDLPASAFPVAEILYVEPSSSPVDIAFLKLSLPAGSGSLAPIPVSSARLSPEEQLCAIGYPAKAPRRLIPDQDLMHELFRGAYDVKRVAPGRLLSETGELLTHDCTTLGGNSGCAVVSLRSGAVVGLHFAGVYLSENRAVPASVLNEYANRRRWLLPPSVETSDRKHPTTYDAANGGLVDMTITVSIRGGVSTVSTQGALPVSAGVDPHRSVGAFLDRRFEGVVAARIGYLVEGERIGEIPAIVVSVKPSRLSEMRQDGPAVFGGLPVLYEAATLLEQLEDVAADEATAAIAYDDDARTAPAFVLEPVTEDMMVRAHVSPEYGFDELSAFLSGPSTHLVSAMYEFKGAAIADVVEQALEAGTSMVLAIDNVTLPQKRDEPRKLDDLEFEAAPRFDDWHARFAFDYTKIPEGRRGLIKNSYHIKVTVRDDDHFWLSSGNWKNTSSQPIVTDLDRSRAIEDDLPGNRDWHIVVQSPKLSGLFRNHIVQDIKRSRQLGDDEGTTETGLFVAVPRDEPEVAVERKAPSRLLKPLVVEGRIKVWPLLTPDNEGRVYTDAVLSLIKSARRSLWFQIPYIGMRPDPRVDRGNIDELIEALCQKMVEVPDARVLLRTGNSKFSDNRHVAWYMKSKGVDIDNCLRTMDDHHTKGMVVDGRRVLIGSHNWSNDGVSVNRDASLIFDDPALAGYYGEAFVIDWQRANPVRPKRFVKTTPEIVAANRTSLERPDWDVVPLREYLSELDE